MIDVNKNSEFYFCDMCGEYIGRYTKTNGLESEAIRDGYSDMELISCEEDIFCKDCAAYIIARDYSRLESESKRQLFTQKLIEHGFIDTPAEIFIDRFQLEEFICSMDLENVQKTYDILWEVYMGGYEDEDSV